MMVDTKVKDHRLDQIQEAPDLEAVARAIDAGRYEDAQATSLWLIAFELRLIRQTLDSVTDRGKVITQAFEG